MGLRDDHILTSPSLLLQFEIEYVGDLEAMSEIAQEFNESEALAFRVKGRRKILTETLNVP
jgi:hypothetical protein